MKKLFSFFITCLFVLLLFSEVSFADGQQEGAKAETVKVDLWSHLFSASPTYEPFWATAAEKFNVERPEVNFSINVINVPYEGYEAKYSSAFAAKKGPGIFNGMTQVWVDRFDVCDPMPKDIVESIEKVLLPMVKSYGMHDGTRYGLPGTGAAFMMMYINAGMFKESGLDPDNPPQTYMDLLDYAKKMTKYDNEGNITRAGYAIRYKGHPFGVADKSAPFYHAWGAKWLDWGEKKASGYVNSTEAVEALEFYSGLVRVHKVASLEFDNPMTAFGQQLAGIMFREPFYEGWLETNAPDIDFRVYPLPRQKMESGVSTNFPWAENVNRGLSETERRWVWEFFRWYVNNPEIRKQHYVESKMFPVYKDIIDDPSFTNLKVFDAWKTMTQGRTAPEYFITPAHEILSIVGEATLNSIYGKAKPKDALDNAAIQMDAVLAKYK